MHIFLLDITERLIQLDRDLFKLVNERWSWPALDGLMMGLRNPLAWIPLYAFVLIWLLRRHRALAWQFILASLLTVAVTDFVSASVLKPLFLRLRPCADPVLQPVIRSLVGCGGRYGMPSSHAANHFGLATCWYFAVQWMSGRRWLWLWIWAALICYAQVYVGKHFPGDVVAGALLGTCVGFLFATLFRQWMLNKTNSA